MGAYLLGICGCRFMREVHPVSASCQRGSVDPDLGETKHHCLGGTQEDRAPFRPGFVEFRHGGSHPKGLERVHDSS